MLIVVCGVINFEGCAITTQPFSVSFFILLFYDTTFLIFAKPSITCLGRILAYICVVCMLVWPSIFDTTSIGISLPRAMVVAKVCRPTWEERCLPIPVSWAMRDS